MRLSHAAVAALAVMSLLAPLAWAQSADATDAAAGTSVRALLDRYFWGKNTASVGLFYIHTADSAEPLETTTTALGLGTYKSPGTSSTVSDEVTPALTFKHFFTEHVAVAFAFGVPPTFDIRGRGIVIAPVAGIAPLQLVDLGAPDNNPLLSVRQWSPALELQYFFNPETSRVRPFVGVGLTYTFFTDIQLNRTFENRLRDLGPLLQLGMGKLPTGPATVQADLSSSWQPVLTAGMQYEFI